VADFYPLREDEANMSKTPSRKRPILPKNVRQLVADVAKVPKKNRKDFDDLIRLPVQMIWELDRRATGTKAQKALFRAAEAARALHEAFANLSPDDRKWVDELWGKWPQYEKWLPALPRSVEALAHLFSLAVNKALPQGSTAHQKRGRRSGDVKDLSFREFVHYLLVVAEEWCGGNLTFDKNYESGTLIKAIEILSPYLPAGLVPDPLPFQTIQRVKTDRGHYAGFADITFFRGQ
jgi:hypothetical protein